MADDAVLQEIRDHILILTMNRPERMNTGNDVRDGLQQAYRDYMANDDLWCAILTGAGRAFHAGADIKATAERYAAGGSTPPPPPEPVEVWKPLIAAVNGYCVAGGLLIAADCDMRIAADTAQFWLGEVNWSMQTPEKIMLPWYMPLGVALEMALTGERFSAQRMYEAGFVNRVVPPDQLMSAAMEMAERICRNAPLAVRAHKESILRLLEVPKTAANPLVKDIMSRVTDSEDAREGTRAFAEKRPPAWQNR